MATLDEMTRKKAPSLDEMSRRKAPSLDEMAAAPSGGGGALTTLAAVGDVANNLEQKLGSGLGRVLGNQRVQDYFQNTHSSPVSMLLKASGLVKPEEVETATQSMPVQIAGGVLDIGAQAALSAVGLPFLLAANLGGGVEGQIQDAETVARARGEEATGSEKLSAAGVGLVRGGIETLLPAYLGGRILSKPTGRVAAGLVGGAAGAAEEAAGEAVGNIGAGLTYDEGRAWDRGVGESATVGGAVGTILGAALPGRSKTVFNEGEAAPPPAQDTESLRLDPRSKEDDEVTRTVRKAAEAVDKARKVVRGHPELIRQLEIQKNALEVVDKTKAGAVQSEINRLYGQLRVAQTKLDNYDKSIPDIKTAVEEVEGTLDAQEALPAPEPTERAVFDPTIRPNTQEALTYNPSATFAVDSQGNVGPTQEMMNNSRASEEAAVDAMVDAKLRAEDIRTDLQATRMATDAAEVEAQIEQGQTSELAQGVESAAAGQQVDMSGLGSLVNTDPDDVSTATISQGPLEREILDGRNYSELTQFKTADQLADWLSNNSDSQFEKSLAQRLKSALGSNTQVVFFSDGDTAPAKVAEALKSAYGVSALRRNDNSVTIFLPRDGTNPTLALHELTHAATQKAIRDKRNSGAVKELDAILKYVRQVLSDPNQAATNRELADEAYRRVKDVDELLAYFFSSPTFRRYLSSVDAANMSRAANQVERAYKDGAPKMKERNLLQVFWDAIRKLLGLNPHYQKKFEELFDKETNQYNQIVQSAQNINNAGFTRKLDALFQQMLDSNPTAVADSDVISTDVSKAEASSPTVQPQTGDKSDNSVAKSRLANLWEGVADRLENSNLPQVQKLGTAVRDYVDTRAANQGAFESTLKPALDTYGAMTSTDRQKMDQLFEQYQAAVMMNDVEAVNRILDTAPREAVTILKSVRDALDTANKIVQDSGLMIFDRATNKARPYKGRRNYFPLFFKSEIGQALRDPYAAKNSDVINRLAKWVIDSKKTNQETGETIKTWKEAVEYLTREYSMYGSGRIEDFFGNLERSRTQPMPPWAYDLSLSALSRYKDRWSARAAQVKHFGQTIGTQRNLFQQVVEDSPITKEERDYIITQAREIYGTDEKGVDVRRTDLERALNVGSTAATGLQIGNFLSALKNLSGMGLTMANYGFINSGKAFADMSKPGGDFDKMMADAERAGVVRSDNLHLLSDQHILGEHFDALEKAQRAVNVATTVALRLSLFQQVERYVRLHAARAAKYWVQSGMEAVETKPDSVAAKEFKRYLARQGVSYEKLLAERASDGPRPEWDKLSRRAVNLVQGSYQRDQVPSWAMSQMGQFFFKYYKFGTQVLRNFNREFVNPLIEAKTANERAYHGLRTLRFLAAAGVMGELTAELSKALFDTMPDVEDLARSVNYARDGKWAAALASLGQSAMDAILYSGMLGLAGQAVELADQFHDVYNNRLGISDVDTPIQAPVLAPLGGLMDLANRMRLNYEKDGNPLPTLADLNAVGNSTLSYYRAGKKLAINVAGFLTDDSFRSAKLQSALRDRQYTTQLKKEFLKETGKQFIDPLANSKEWKDLLNPFANLPSRGPNTAANRQINEALILGETKRARELIEKQLRMESTKGDLRRRLNSIKQSLDRFDPMYFPGAPNQDAAREEFIQWVRNNIHEGDAERLIGIHERFRETQRKAGVVSTKRIPRKDPELSQDQINRGANQLLRPYRGDEDE